MAKLPLKKTRELHYSNPDVSIKNQPTGTALYRNVARVHRENGCTVGAFYTNTPPPFNADISLAQMDCYMGQAEAITQCGEAPYSFYWESSTDGVNYSYAGNTEEIYFYFNCQVNTFMNFKLTITDALSAVQIVYKHIELSDDYPARAIRNKETKQLVQKIFPNPFRNLTNVELDLPISAPISITILDPAGNIRAKVFNGVLLKGQRIMPINLSGLKTGIYQLCVSSANSIEKHQLIITK